MTITMVWLELILLTHLKNINIGGKNHVAYADTALVKVFTNRYIVNNTLIIKCVILIRSAETLNMRRIKTDRHRVYQIELTITLCNIFELVFTLCHKCNKYNCLP